MQRETTISVVIPAYNAGRYIEDAIASVLAQDTPADEIIVVNDGSTDRDYSALERLHPSIRVMHQPNRGVSAARNLGCSVANGSHVAILDADDIWLKSKLRAQVDHLSTHPAVDAVFCRGLVWLPAADGSTWREAAAPHEDCASAPEAIHLHYPDFLCSIPVAPSTMMIKKSVWQELGGFNEKMRFGEDQDFYLRLSYDWQVDLLDMVGMLYRRHPSSATAVTQEPNHLADVIIKTIGTLGTTDKFGHRADPDALARYLSGIHFQHGYAHFRSGGFRVARREFRLAVSNAQPTRKAWVYFLLSGAPGIREGVRWLLALRPEREARSTGPQSI